MWRLSRNMGALTSRTPQGHVGLFRGYFTFSFTPSIALYAVPSVLVPVMNWMGYILRSWDRASLMYSSITNKMQRHTNTIKVLRVSGGSSAHHQGIKSVYTAWGIRLAFSASYRYREWVGTSYRYREFQPTHDSGKKQKKLDKYPMLFIQFWAPDDGRRNNLKHV
jgi:hypothetical protein